MSARDGAGPAVTADAAGETTGRIAARDLCGLEEIADGEARGFVVERAGQPQEMLVVRKGLQVWGYRNLCPHIGAALDWAPDQFMDPNGEHIMCAMHGALFRAEEGVCVAGPCTGDRLTPLPVRIEAGRVVLEGGTAD
jgi:nitrite reductase/ring-hydroxylating ferredoxin subunit